MQAVSVQDAHHDVSRGQALDVLAEVLREVARRRRLSPEDADDFTQAVHARFIERGYDVFRRFTGRSSLRTYLRVVVERLLLDWRNQAYGKWRTSAAARRMGPLAQELERLIHRDGHTVGEAIEIVRSRRALALPVDRIADMALALPARTSRRPVAREVLEHQAVEFADPIEASESSDAGRRLRIALDRAVRALPAADRRLLALHYRDGYSMRRVAQLLGMDAKAVYRRYERVRRVLRRAVEDTTSVHVRAAGGRGKALRFVPAPHAMPPRPDRAPAPLDC